MDRKNCIVIAALWSAFVQPVQAGPEQPNVFEGINILSKQTFCSTICDPLFLLPPILCQITEIKNECLTRCPGVISMDKKKAINLTRCKKFESKPLAEVTQKKLDQFCMLACTSLSCSNYAITVKGTKISWSGKDFGRLVCQNLCKGREKIIEGCLRAINKPVKLP